MRRRHLTREVRRLTRALAKAKRREREASDDAMILDKMLIGTLRELRRWQAEVFDCKAVIHDLITEVKHLRVEREQPFVKQALEHVNAIKTHFINREKGAPCKQPRQ